MADVLQITFQGNASSLIAAAGAAAGALGAVEAATGKAGHGLGTIESSAARASSGLSGLVGIAGSVTSALGTIGLAAQGIRSIADAAIGAGKAMGLGLAGELETVTSQFNAMTKDGAVTAGILADIRAEANRTPFAFQEMAKAAASLMPASKQSGIALMDLIKTAEVLAASNPAEGLEGAAFSIREALSGDFVSIVERFNLPRTRLNELKAQGVPAMQAISTAMREMGLDADLVGNMATTMTGRWSTFMDSVDTARLALATPLFDVLKDGLVGIQAVFDANQATITGWATTVGQTIGTTVRDSFRQLGDAVRTVQQVFADDWLPSDEIEPFAKMVGIAAAMVRDFSRWVADLPAPLQAAAAGFAATIAAVGPLNVVLGIATGAVAAVGAALAFLASPIGLVAAAVGVLAAAWVGNWFGIQEATTSAWAAMQPTFAALVDWLGAQIPPVLNWISTVGWPVLVAAGQAATDWIMGTAVPAFQSIVTWLGTNIPPVLTWISETGWPSIVSAGEAVSGWITGTAIPAFTDLVEWLGPKISAVTTWITGTGWPALVAAGEKVGTMVGTVSKFFQDLYVELDKRQVFEQLGTIWNTLTGIGDLLWAAVQKIGQMLAPVITQFGETKTRTDALVGAGALPALVGLFGKFGEVVAAAGGPVQVIGAGLQFAVEQVTKGLKPLTDFVAAMDALSKIKLPSFNFGGPVGTPGMQMTSLSGRATSAPLANPDASEAEIDEYIAQAARARRFSEDDVRKAVETSRGERDGKGARAVGDGGKSFGPLQLYTGGGVGNRALKDGIDVRDPRTWKQQVEYALDVMRDEGYGQWSVARDKGYTGKPQITAPSTSNGTRGPVVPGALSSSYWTSGGTHGGAPAADIFAARGTPITAPVGGISRPMQVPEGGNATIIQGDDGRYYYMAHGDTPFAGGRVERGATIGSVGNSGNARGTDPHLHYAIADDPNVFGRRNGSGNITGDASDWRGGGPALRDMQRSVPGMDPSQWPGFMNQVEEQLPAYLMSLDTIQQHGSEAFASVLDAGVAAGGMLVSASTDDLGNVTRIYSDATGAIGATITDAAGIVVNAWGTMGTGVTEQTATMAQTVLTSVTDLGSGLLTTITDSAGSTVATVTGMSGQVTSQYATLANGVTLTMGDMAGGVLTSVTDMGSGMVTIVQDANGNMVGTVTDAAGKVTNQYTTMASSSGSAVTQLASTTSSATGQMSSSMQSVGSAASGMDRAINSVRPMNLSQQIGELKKLESAANSAAQAVKKFADGTSGSGGNKSISSALSKRHGGGPVEGGMAYITGGPGAEELFVAPPGGGYIHNPSDTRHILGGGGGAIDEGRLAKLIASELAAVMPRRGDVHISGAGTEDVIRETIRELRRQDAGDAWRG